MYHYAISSSPGNIYAFSVHLLIGQVNFLIPPTIPPKRRLRAIVPMCHCVHVPFCPSTMVTFKGAKAHNTPNWVMVPQVDYGDPMCVMVTKIDCGDLQVQRKQSSPIPQIGPW